ncbi:glycosyltransferase family 2 protein, partial [Lactobacillus helveticus]
LIASFLNRKVKDPDRKYKYDLSIVLIVKNEGKYIQEWIEYYKILGFSRFYIFDNDSTDDTKQKLKKYIDHGLVDYNVIHGKARQMDAYN